MKFEVVFEGDSEKVTKKFEAPNALNLFAVLTDISYPNVPQFLGIRNGDGEKVIPSTVLKDLRQTIRVKRHEVSYAAIGVVYSASCEPEDVVRHYLSLKEEAKEENDVDIFDLLARERINFHDRLSKYYP